VLVVVGQLWQGLEVIRVLRQHRRSSEEVLLVAEIVLGAEIVRHLVERLPAKTHKRVLDPGIQLLTSLTGQCGSLGGDVAIPHGNAVAVTVLGIFDMVRLIVLVVSLVVRADGRAIGG